MSWHAQGWGTLCHNCLSLLAPVNERPGTQLYWQWVPCFAVCSLPQSKSHPHSLPCLLKPLRRLQQHGCEKLCFTPKRPGVGKRAGLWAGSQIWIAASVAWLWRLAHAVWC